MLNSLHLFRKQQWVNVLGLLLWIHQPFVAVMLPTYATIKGIKGYPQTSSLSCESRSAVDWAAFFGVKIKEKKFLGSLPRSDNPEEGFVGNSNDAWGAIPPASYGVHAAPVADLLNHFGVPAQARKGMSWRELRKEIANGRPVIVWVIGQMNNGSPILYHTKSGKNVIVAHYEHTMILVGYDRTSVEAIDAFSGQRRTYPLKNFLASWSVLGNMAIVYQK